MSDGFESRAEEWLAWARTPGHDAYRRYRDAFAELLPPPRGRTLEIGRVARAESLPFADGSFALVVADNVLMDVADVDATLRQCAHVLAPAGRLCACVTHPLADPGRWSGDERCSSPTRRRSRRRAWPSRRSASRRPPPTSPSERWRPIPMFLMLRAVRPAG